MASNFKNKIRVRVCGILINEKNEILVAEHSGLNKSDSFLIPPGGGIEFGEKMEDALIREFQEETGLLVRVGNLIKVFEHISTDKHAVELFFKIISWSGNLITGVDPEYENSNQFIKNIKFVTLTELEVIPLENKHKVLLELKKLNIF